MPEAQDFDDISLEIRGLGGGRFETRVQGRGQGEVVGPFGMVLDASTLRPLMTVFNPASYGFGPDAHTIGSTLFNALFQGDVLRLFDRTFSGSNDARSDGTSRGVRLRILMDLKDKEIRPLAALPWELLHDPLNRIFYGHGRQRLLVRHPESPRPMEPLAVIPPLRVLLVPSSPKDQPALNLKAETGALEEALKQDDRIEVEVLRPATVHELLSALRAKTFHVLHFMGHGGFNADTGQGRLYFERDDGNSETLDGAFFSDLLAELPHLQLVVLNACRTAQVPGALDVGPYGKIGRAHV